MALCPQGHPAPSDDRGVSSIHETEDGLVHLLVVPDKEGGWRATIFGQQLACARHFDSVAGANSYVIASFSQMFPEHLCGSKCAPASEAAQRHPSAGSPRLESTDEPELGQDQLEV